MKQTIVIVEDEAVNRESLANVYRKRGFDVITCTQGKEAWSRLWELPAVDLVVTDMMMPDMDGRELVQLMRAHQEFSATPVIIVSGIIKQTQVSDLIEMGPTRFLAKPVMPQELVKVSAELMEIVLH